MPPLHTASTAGGRRRRTRHLNPPPGRPLHLLPPAPTQLEPPLLCLLLLPPALPLPLLELPPLLLLLL